MTSDEAGRRGRTDEVAVPMGIVSRGGDTVEQSRILRNEMHAVEVEHETVRDDDPVDDRAISLHGVTLMWLEWLRLVVHAILLDGESGGIR